MIETSTGNAYGDIVTIDCEPGYALSTRVNFTICSTDGMWFPDPGYCNREYLLLYIILY